MQLGNIDQGAGKEVNLISCSNYLCDHTAKFWASSYLGTATLLERAMEIRWEESDLMYLETHPLSPRGRFCNY